MPTDLNSEPPLILASSSPRRRAILESLGAAFSVISIDVDESPLADESPDEMVLRLAQAKAKAVARQRADNALVLGADTAVVLGEEIFGKPQNEDDGLRMLLALSGRAHKVYTGVALVVAGRISTALSTTEVQFREIRPDEARRYWHSGEPRGKAGAYAIQGSGGLFVESIMGSYSGVVGLPVFETAALLSAAGFQLLPEPASGA